MITPQFDGTDQRHVALWLAERHGLHVFPVDSPALPHCAGVGRSHDPSTCTDRGKHPAVPWGTWAARYGTDALEISARWADTPYNVGVACAPSALVVLDEDDLGALDRLADAHGQTYPRTLIVTTGRGRHMYLRDTTGGRIGNSSALAQWHIDVRGAGGRHGGYVVGPGSLHSTGVIYTPVDPDAPIADIPDWLVDLLAPAQSHETPEGRPRHTPETTGRGTSQPHQGDGAAWRQHQDVIPHGQRHQALVSYAGRLRASGLSIAEVTPAYRQFWERCAQPPQASDAYTWDEAEATLRDVYERYAAGRDLPAADPTDDAAGVRRVRSQPITQIKRRRRQYLWEHRLPLGELTIFAGHAGIGKSQAAVWLAARVTRGELPGELQGVATPVLYLGTEDSWEYTLAPRFDAAAADPSKVFRLYVETENGEEDVVSLAVDLDSLRAEVETTGARLIVLDALLSTFGSAKLTEQGVVRRHLEPLARLAQELNIAVVGVAHFRKASDANPLHMLAGSVEFGQVVRSAVGFAPDREAEDGSCVLSLIKTNLAPSDLPSLRYRIEPCTVDTDEGPTDVGRFVLLGETDQGVEDLLNREHTTAEDRSERDEAAEWLLTFLRENGWEVARAEVMKAARKEGFSDATLKRAKMRAKVRHASGGFPRTTVWIHPEFATESNDAVGSPLREPTGGEPTELTGLTCENASSVSQSAQGRTREPTGAPSGNNARTDVTERDRPARPDEGAEGVALAEVPEAWGEWSA